jgi:hypothetical protein
MRVFGRRTVSMDSLLVSFVVFDFIGEDWEKKKMVILVKQKGGGWFLTPPPSFYATSIMNNQGAVFMT